MIRYLLGFDHQLFLTINHLPHNLILDTIFGIVTFVGSGGAIWIIFALRLYFQDKLKHKKLMRSMIFAEMLYLSVVELFLKNFSHRPRPQFEIPTTILPYDFSRSFSFPSGHVTVAFAATYILGRYHKRLKWFYYLLAFLIAFSRVYLGKHYPSDVLVGAVIGLLIGFYSNKLMIKLTLKPTKLQL